MSFLDSYFLLNHMLMYGIAIRSNSLYNILLSKLSMTILHKYGLISLMQPVMLSFYSDLRTALKKYGFLGKITVQT